MTDELYRAVGEANGKLDTLTNLVRDYIEAHDKRHERVDEQITAHAADINKAKGAKTAVLILAGGLASVVSIAVAAASKLFGG